MSQIDDILGADEGFREKPYLDCCGKYWRDCTCKLKGQLTIGIGRNLDGVGISMAEAKILLQNDIALARAEASKYFWFSGLDPVRQDVVTMMIFNLGAPKFAKFQRLMSALALRNFDTAAEEMLNSHWAAEVGKRAVRLSEMMRSGSYGSVAQG